MLQSLSEQISALNFGQAGLGVLLGLIIAESRNIVANFRSKRRDYAGKWLDEIFDDNGAIIKRDLFLIEQDGNFNLKGTIERTFPVERPSRKYEFVRHVKDGSIIAIFWQKAETGDSYGCLHVKRTAYQVYEGFYISGAYLERVKAGHTSEMHPSRILLRKV